MLDRPERECVTIDLPCGPFSTNDIWAPVARGKYAAMVRSKAYLKWASDAGFLLNSQRPGRVDGHFALHLYVDAGRRLDLDNAIKASLDLLQAQGVIENDRKCVSIRAKRANVDGMRIMVVRTKVAVDAR